MRDYIIITDACSDLDKKMRDTLNVSYIPVMLMHDEKEISCDLDWESFESEQFYRMLDAGANFKTVQISVEKYLEYFRNHLKDGYDILSLSTSGALSGSVGSSRIARDILLDEFPISKIYCVDTLRSSLGEGLIVYYAAKLKQEGKTIDEVYRWVEDNKQHINQIGSVSTITYLKNAGRIKGTVTFMDHLFNTKHIILSDETGNNITIKKVNGRKKSIRKCIRVLKHHIVDPGNKIIFLSHADCKDEAEYIRKVLMEEVMVSDVYVNLVGPGVGASVGPGMFGIYYYSERVDASD